MQKLFVTDLDKTLLNSSGYLSQTTVEAWNRLVDQGVLLSIATARSANRLREMVADLKTPIPLIVLNGAMMVEADGSFKHIRSINGEWVDELLRVGSTMGFEGFVMGIENGAEVLRHVEPRCAHTQRFLGERWGADSRRAMVASVSPLEHTQLVQFVGDQQPLSTLRNLLAEQFNKNLDLKFSEDVYFPGSFSLEIQHKKADKAVALAQLGADCGVPESHWVVFGDNFNDIGMLKRAGTGVAVKNAVKELKDSADVVLDHSNDDDAVVRYISTLTVGPWC